MWAREGHLCCIAGNELSDLHYEPYRKDSSAHKLAETRVVLGNGRRASLNDLQEKTTCREEDACYESLLGRGSYGVMRKRQKEPTHLEEDMVVSRSVLHNSVFNHHNRDIPGRECARNLHRFHFRLLFEWSVSLGLGELKLTIAVRKSDDLGERSLGDRWRWASTDNS